MVTKNPYLMLGVDFGASADEARKAYAAAVRRLRSAPEGPYSRDDLTWALSELERLEHDPVGQVSLYRVPANPALFDRGGYGLFAPPPALLPRRTSPDDSAEFVSDLRRDVAAQLLDDLLAGLAACGLAARPYPLETDT